MLVTMPRVIADMLSSDAVSDGAEHLHLLLKGVEVNTGQTEDYPLCLSFVKSVGIDGRLTPLVHCCVNDASLTS
jgi:hypothetical protein